MARLLALPGVILGLLYSSLAPAQIMRLDPPCAKRGQPVTVRHYQTKGPQTTSCRCSVTFDGIAVVDTAGNTIKNCDQWAFTVPDWAENEAVHIVKVYYRSGPGADQCRWQRLYVSENCGDAPWKSGPNLDKEDPLKGPFEHPGWKTGPDPEDSTQEGISLQFLPSNEESQDYLDGQPGDFIDWIPECTNLGFVTFAHIIYPGGAGASPPPSAVFKDYLDNGAVEYQGDYYWVDFSEYATSPVEAKINMIVPDEPGTYKQITNRVTGGSKEFRGKEKRPKVKHLFRYDSPSVGKLMDLKVEFKTYVYCSEGLAADTWYGHIDYDWITNATVDSFDVKTKLPIISRDPPDTGYVLAFDKAKNYFVNEKKSWKGPQQNAPNRGGDCKCEEDQQ